MQYRKLTNEEIAAAANEIKASVTAEQWRSFIKSIYGNEASTAIIESTSEYNDEGYSTEISDITVRDSTGRKIGPVPSLWLKVVREGKAAGKDGYRYAHEYDSFHDIDEEEDADDSIRYAAQREIGIESVGTLKIDLNSRAERDLYVATGEQDVVTFISADDWTGAYVNGELATENHSIGESELGYVFIALGVKLEKKTVDDEWLEECGSLPSHIAEIPANKITD